MRRMIFAIALAASSAAFAQSSAVALTSKLFVAREVTDAQGKKSNKLFDPTTVLPGEALVVILEYKNNGAQPAANFVIDNPVNSSVSFTGVEQPWAVVSVDGGKTYGALATLKVTAADGTRRAAVPQDVTHVRWKFAQPIPAGGTGRVMFYGLVK